MSSNWRALQHRHRYTYSAVIFPQYFIQALDRIPYDSPFFVELRHLVSLNSTYSQLEHVKKLAAAFSGLLSDPKSDAETVFCAVKLYLEILFMENSLPLHRTVACALAKCKNFRSLIEGGFRQLCEEYGGGESVRNGKRFCVARAALSMMSTPKLGYIIEVVEQCALLVGLDVVSGLHNVVNDTSESSRPSPIVMEQCQEALSCMYYLLQKFPGKFCNVGSEYNRLYLNNQSVLEMAFVNVMSILKSQSFSRDCLVAAGVSFFAALQVCLSDDEVGLFIMRGIFHQTDIQNRISDYNDVVAKIPYKGDLVDEIYRFLPLSRLCLIRGILTAVSRTVLDTHYVVPASGLNGYTDLNSNRSSVKTILYDAILPELCIYAENPVDSHSNFHALTVMQICLQQIKTLLQGGSGGFADDYFPVPDEMAARILKIVWNNLEDPLSQTVKQVYLIFDLYLDIHSSLRCVEGNESMKLFLRKIASDLLSLGPRCKGRYVPLSSLTRRLGAKTILDMNPDLLFETIKAYTDDDVCCAATNFLKCFLECLRDEYWSSDGVDRGYTKYRDQCLPPFLHGLASGLAKLRSNLNTYALQALFEVDMESILHMLALIGIGRDEGLLFTSREISCTGMALGLEQQIAVLVSLLKVSRVLALMDGDIDWYAGSLVLEGAVLNVEDSNLYCIVGIKGIEFKVPVKWLILALSNIDESVRMDAAETIFLNPRTASLPSSLELSLMRRAIPLNMRCCSTSFQMKWNSLFRKFLSRARTGLERQIKQGIWKPLVGDSNGVCSSTEAENSLGQRAENLFVFLKWLSSFLFFSCYPSAPYERKIMAMELISIMLNIWPLSSTLSIQQDAFCFEANLCPYSKSLTLPDSTLLLIGSIVDSWDRLRESSFRILLHFPTPLPGVCSPDLVQDTIVWAKKLICSPRVRESDAGALTLRLLFRKYVLDLSWIVKPACESVSFCSNSKQLNNVGQDCTSSSAVVIYVTSIINWLLASVGDAEKNLAEACKNSFVHGILLALRYTFEEVNWNSNAILSSISEMKHELGRLLDLVLRITTLALGAVSADAWFLPDDMEAGADADASFLDIPDEVDPYDYESQDDNTVPGGTGEMRRSEQIVMVGCWLAMKEVSLLLGTIIRKVPLPTSVKMTKSISIAAKEPETDAMLSLEQLETIGNHFLEVLLKMKHNGAIDKTRAGFAALCNRLLCSNDPRLCRLTESWMELLMERTVSEGQTVDDLLRRSAGIPAAFIAFFLSEPEGTPKILLPRALRWLINVVERFLNALSKANSSNSDSCSGLLLKSNQETGCIPSSCMNGNSEISKFRDDGVVPTVHAFNVLRASFNDTNLATDTSGFCAEALMLSIRSFSSSYWEIRNSACLAYTALLRRMIGFFNIQRRESARRALSGLEFFHRYPSLHIFFLDELKVATKLLVDGSSEHLRSDLKSIVHPSLCPILILLSRLRPSPISSEAGDPLDPFLFMPFIRSCSVQSNFRIRVLASGALISLVAYEKLEVVMLRIASELPSEKKQNVVKPTSSGNSSSISGPSSSFNSIHGILLQLNSLVDTNCRSLSDSSKKDGILLKLVHMLATRSWIGRPQLCSCPILNSCIIQLLDNMLSIARNSELSRSSGPIWNLLWDLSSECLNLKPSDGSSYFDPTVQELRKQAATSYFNCVSQTSKEIVEDLLMRKVCPSPLTSSLRVVKMKVDFPQFKDRLIHSMSDESYEVRIATLKWLLLSLRTWGTSQSPPGDEFYSKARETCLTDISLQDIVMKLLDSEKHHKCIHYLLKILYTWNSLDFQDSNQQGEKPKFVCNMGCHSVLQLWNVLVSLFKTARHAKTKQTLICCLGMCARQISNLCMDLISAEVSKKGTDEVTQTDSRKRFSDLYDSLSFFVDVIGQLSDASEPVNIRKAAAESIVASGLLGQAEMISSLVSIYGNQVPDLSPEEAVGLHARKVLDLWSTCIKLLEDEDLGLRKRLALDVQKCLKARKSREDFIDSVAPTQVEKVIELCFEHLSAIFGNWFYYLNYLCCWVLNAANNTNYVVSGGDLVRRVFDKEIDNYHEEKLLICQICCYHLERILVSMSLAGDSRVSSKGFDLLLSWRTKFLKQLMVFADDCTGKRVSMNWIGGMGNHKDTFLQVYANLLAFYVLSNCILKGEGEGEGENTECIRSDLTALGEAIKHFLGSLLISNLYLMVLKSHEKYLDTTADYLAQKLVLQVSAWEEFNPYFLLR